MPHSCCDLLNYTLNPNKTGMNYANNHRPMVKRKSLPLHSTDSKLFVSIFLRYIWGPKNGDCKMDEIAVLWKCGSLS